MSEKDIIHAQQQAAGEHTLLHSQNARQLTHRWEQGWWQHPQVRHVPSPHQHPRHETLNLVVLHAISWPPGNEDSTTLDALFQGRISVADHPALAGLKVSAHFLIDRQGRISQYVSTQACAWHAGRSRWGGAPQCNERSLGVELMGLPGIPFAPAQPPALMWLLEALWHEHPALNRYTVVGHEHIAPYRKIDPGPTWDWGAFRHSLKSLDQRTGRFCHSAYVQL